MVRGGEEGGKGEGSGRERGEKRERLTKSSMVRGGGRGSWGGWGSRNVAQIKGGSTANSVRKEEWDGIKGQTRG